MTGGGHPLLSVGNCNRVPTPPLALPPSEERLCFSFYRLRDSLRLPNVKISSHTHTHVRAQNKEFKREHHQVAKSAPPLTPSDF